MKCSHCGSQFRITFFNGKPYCFLCESDLALIAHGVIRPVKERSTK
jgi:hypothetical protein